MPTYGMNIPGEGGVLGNFPEEVFWPDSSLATAIGALATKELAKGRLVKMSISNNREVSACADGDVFHARIVEIIEDDDKDYELTCRVYAYADKEGNIHLGNHGTDEFPIGTNGATLGQELLVDGADWTSVKGADTGGIGSVQAKDGDSNYCQARL